jgi:hypothetical protein
LTDKDPPYELVNEETGKHLGPFSTYLDAALARTIGVGGWARSPILNKKEFKAWIRSLDTKGRRRT